MRPPPAPLADALWLTLLFVAWGFQVVVPWRIARAAPDAGGGAGGGASAGADRGTGEDGSAGAGAARPAERRRLPALVAPTLVLPGAIAGHLLLARHPGAAVAGRLVPLTASVAGTLVAVLTPALLAITLVAAFAGERLERAGWWIVSCCGAATVLGAAWAGEQLRTGEGPPSSGLALALLVGCRALLALAAGEVLAPGRPAWAAAAGLALPAYLPLLPGALRLLLWHEGQGLTLGAAALLLLAARWLPPPLRRPAVAAGIVLAALTLSRAAVLSETLAPQPPTTAPLPSLPAPHR